MRLKKKFSFTDNNIIWRILLGTNNELVIESRNENSREVFFNILNFDTGKPILSKFQLSEKYWSGIEEVKDGIIFFHKYAKPDLPAHTGIIAIDIKTGSEIWKNEDYSYLFSFEGKVYAYRQLFDKREYHLLDFYTGVELETVELNNMEINTLRENAETYEGVNPREYKFPIVLSNKISPDLLPPQISALYTNNSMQYCEYILFENLYIFSYNIDKAGRKYQKLVIPDTNSGKFLLEKTINKTDGKIVPDSFFVYQNSLILIEHKKVLTIFNLK